MKAFSFWRFGSGVLILTVISEIIHFADGIFGMKYYIDPNYFSVWSTYMMPTAGPPPASFYYMSIGFTLIGMILFALVYEVLKNAIPGKTLLAKGAIFGLLMFFISGVSGALAMVLIIKLPVGLILLWTAEDLAIKLFGGMALAKLVK